MSEEPEQRSALHQEYLDIDERRTKRIGDLLDYNSDITKSLRSQVQEWQTIAEAYEQGKQTCLEISEMSAVQARIAADMTGDIISTEFGLVEVEEIDEEPEGENV